MRWGLLSIRFGILAVYLFVTAAVVLSMISLTSGGLRVESPVPTSPDRHRAHTRGHP